MPVQHKLPRSTPTWRKSEPVHQIVQSHLQQLQQHLAGYATLSQSTLKYQLELAFL
jgi:hypothetical protein